MKFYSERQAETAEKATFEWLFLYGPELRNWAAVSFLDICASLRQTVPERLLPLLRVQTFAEIPTR